MRLLTRTVVVIFTVAACSATVDFVPVEQTLEVTDVGTFNEPVQLVDHVSGMWVVERGGRVVSFDGEVLVDLEIDISEGSQESGLLGLEFGDDRFWLYVANPEDGTSGLYEVTSEIVTHLGHCGSEHFVDSVCDDVTTVLRNEHRYPEALLVTDTPRPSPSIRQLVPRTGQPTCCSQEMAQ